MSKEQYRPIAKRLYVEENLSYREIAAQMPVSEKQIGRWSRDGQWRKERTEFAKKKSSAVCNLMGVIDSHIEKLRTAPEEELDARAIDMLIKLVKAHKTLRGEMEIPQAVSIAFGEFMPFLTREAPDLAEVIVPHLDRFWQQVWSKK